MTYVEGFVVAVPTANKEAYRKHAAEAAPLFKEFGVRRMVECWGDDVPDGKVNDFKGAVQAKDDETVAAWHAAGLAAGGICDGEPGPRERAPNQSVGAYLRDPDGNKICAFHMRH